MATHIGDPDDPRVDDYRELTDPSERRRREGDEFFIAEGPTAIERLVTSGHEVRSVLVSEQRFERLSPVLRRTEAPVFVAPIDVLRQIVGFDLHRGVVAAANRRPQPTLAEVLSAVSRVAVLEGLNDPENLGAIARSARAFGIDALLLDPTCIDPYYRRAVRVSMGEVLHLAVVRAEQWPHDLDLVRAHGFETWALIPDVDADDIWTCPVPERLAVMFGSEGPGLHARTAAAASRRVRIPIAADVDSLNVAAAAAVTFAIVGARTATPSASY